ncbi:hypothetical protein [Xanthomonas euvesicatoria]|uniref:hypothetical protein n=1 Tax=Xanthomonas euvesicatoria TaxID=456327 RepID=UPI000AD26498|nr:hypothetical protein [Xanthomonas euvesicatoria]
MRKLLNPYAIQPKQPAPRRLSGPKKELIYVDASNVLIESDAHVLNMRELLKLHKEDLERRSNSVLQEIARGS